MKKKTMFKLGAVAISIMLAMTLIACPNNNDDNGQQQPDPETLTISPAGPINPLYVDDEQVLTAVIGPAGATGTINWSVDNANVTLSAATGASVTVTGAVNGPATVTAVVAGFPAATRSVEFTVDTRPNPGTLNITPTGPITDLAIGDYEILTAEIGPAGAIGTITWSIVAGGADFVELSSTTGTSVTVTGLAAGNATVTAVVDDFPAATASVEFTVLPDPESLNITPPGPITDLVLNDTQVLEAAIGPLAAAGHAINWSVNNANVTLSAATGTEVTVTGAAAGNATVTATVEGFATVTANVEFTVVLPDPEGLTIEPAGPIEDLAQGANRVLNATILPAGAEGEINWEVNNSNVTLSATTGASVTVTGAELGPATVTAVVAGFSAATATVEFTVVEPPAAVLLTSVDFIPGTVGGNINAGVLPGGGPESFEGTVINTPANDAFPNIQNSQWTAMSASAGRWAAPSEPLNRGIHLNSNNATGIVRWDFQLPPGNYRVVVRGRNQWGVGFPNPQNVSIGVANETLSILNTTADFEFTNANGLVSINFVRGERNVPAANQGTGNEVQEIRVYWLP